MEKNSKIKKDKKDKRESGYIGRWVDDDDFKRRITPFFGESRWLTLPIMGTMIIQTEWFY